MQSPTKYQHIPTQTTLRRKASGMTCWFKAQLSIISMQIEKEVLHLPLDFRKAQWKTWYMHPFPLAIHFLWKNDSYITASLKFEANTWQPNGIFFLLFLFTEQRKSGIDPPVRILLIFNSPKGTCCDSRHVEDRNVLNLLNCLTPAGQLTLLASDYRSCWSLSISGWTYLNEMWEVLRVRFLFFTS